MSSSFSGGEKWRLGIPFAKAFAPFLLQLSCLAWSSSSQGRRVGGRAVCYCPVLGPAAFGALITVLFLSKTLFLTQILPVPLGSSREEHQAFALPLSWVLTLARRNSEQCLSFVQYWMKISSKFCLSGYTWICCSWGTISVVKDDLKGMADHKSQRSEVATVIMASCPPKRNWLWLEWLNDNLLFQGIGRQWWQLHSYFLQMLST